MKILNIDLVQHNDLKISLTISESSLDLDFSLCAFALLKPPDRKSSKSNEAEDDVAKQHSNSAVVESVRIGSFANIALEPRIVEDTFIGSEFTLRNLPRFFSIELSRCSTPVGGRLA